MRSQPTGPPPLPLPLRVERRITNQAAALDRELQRIIARVRADPNAPGRSFVGEFFVLQEAAFRLGRDVGDSNARKRSPYLAWLERPNRCGVPRNSRYPRANRCVLDRGHLGDHEIGPHKWPTDEGERR